MGGIAKEAGLTGSYPVAAPTFPDLVGLWSVRVETLRYVLGAWSAPFPSMDSEQTLVLVFGAAELGEREELFDRLAVEYPTSHLIGCSTAGEIDQERIWDESLTVAVVQFERAQVRRAHAMLERAKDSYTAGRELAAQLRAPHAGADLRAVFVLSCGTDVNGSELVRGLNAQLPPSVVVTGGLAGDGDRFGETWVLANGRTSPGAAVAIGLYGDTLRISCGSQGGWDAAGFESVVTCAAGNVVYELDGRPALEKYKEALGDRAVDLPGCVLQFPLEIRGDDGSSVMRTVLGVDELRQSLMLAGEMPVGSLAKLMKASSDRLIFGARAAGAAIGEHHGPTLALAISCIGRRLVLGERANEEVAATLQRLPCGTQQIGFYAYGEVARAQDSARSGLHNQTMTLTVFSETE